MRVRRASSGEEFETIEEWNAEDALELQRSTLRKDFDLAIAARDWTVDTIVQQVSQGNIDLDPAFQRRNAWRDPRRSRLIESFILGFPVPQIVLAENPAKKRTFIVIDGKQRLLTIAGFFLRDYRDYWTQSRLVGLNVLKELNKVEIEDFIASPQYSNSRRLLGNADIRTTIITGFADESVLYDIFYRINTGSVPLSSQELRQVLNQGEFAKYLLEVTTQENSLWRVLGTAEPDPRLRDVELLLRLVAWRLFSEKYTGNLKPFLDSTMKHLNSEWISERAATERTINLLLRGVDVACEVYGHHVGRKYKNRTFETSLNRSLIEVQALFFSVSKVAQAAKQRKQEVLTGFKSLCEDTAFLGSLESTTKSIDNYQKRFEKYRGMLEKVLKIKVQRIQIGRPR